jgi:16S rRNA (uracil1498-N3)-methyltransferase
MRLSRIYTAQRLDSNTTIVLEPEPSHHLARVLRLGVGDGLVLFDGSGGEYPGEITAIDKKAVQVRTGDLRDQDCESPLSIHLGIAVSRGERMDWIVQKSTELGVRAITPLSTEHSGVKLSADRANKKILHWQKIAVGACEQCGRSRLPTIFPMQAFNPWVESVEAERKVVLHHRANSGNFPGEPATSVALLIGPEGGLSDEEIERAGQAGFSSLGLGPRVLRTETAPLAAIAILQSYWGDMKPE